MSTHALFLVRMDIAHDHESTFNEVYDREHAPNLRGVPGVRRAARYRQPSPTEPRYLAAYELDSLAVIARPSSTISTTTSTCRSCSSCPAPSMRSAIGRLIRASRAISAHTRSRTP